MVWGNSNWSNTWASNSGTDRSHSGSSGWGNSGSSQSSFGHSHTPQGTHEATCPARAAKIWGGHGHYHEHCPGCRYDRANERVGSKSNAKGVLKVLAIASGGKMLARKSLWG